MRRKSGTEFGDFFCILNYPIYRAIFKSPWCLIYPSYIVLQKSAPVGSLSSWHGRVAHTQKLSPSSVAFCIGVLPRRLQSHGSLPGSNWWFRLLSFTMAALLGHMKHRCPYSVSEKATCEDEFFSRDITAPKQLRIMSVKLVLVEIFVCADFLSL